MSLGIRISVAVCRISGGIRLTLNNRIFSDVVLLFYKTIKPFRVRYVSLFLYWTADWLGNISDKNILKFYGKIQREQRKENRDMITIFKIDSDVSVE